MRVIKTEKAVWADDAAKFLRELADKMEAGDVSEIAVIWNDRGQNAFGGYGMHNDKWRMLGALEHAKMMTHAGGDGPR
jgi:hypothetical protein